MLILQQHPGEGPVAHSYILTERIKFIILPMKSAERTYEMVSAPRKKTKMRFHQKKKNVIKHYPIFSHFLHDFYKRKTKLHIGLVRFTLSLLFP